MVMTVHTAARTRGWSLLELVVVLAIVAGLSLAVLPSYTGSMHKARLSEAQAALYIALQDQERYFSQHFRYASIAPQANQYQQVQGPHPQVRNFAGPSWEQASWRIAATACADADWQHCVQLVAFPLPSAARELPALELSSTGARTCRGAATTLCW